jgi:leader peptidase (prepilin peptidase)/N-methyltransferase
MEITHGWWWGAVFCWGAIWGSFLNVVIYRVPLGLSILRPGSRCTSCKTPIAWYNNIPILSWLLLRGRCASCKVSFSVRYPLVELVTAGMTLGVWIKLTQGGHWEGASPAAAVEILIAWFFLFVFVADLIAIAMIDFDTMRIPDVLSLSPIPLGLFCALFVGDLTGVSLQSSLLGMLIGGGTLWCVTYGYFLLTRREGMGLGDYRLMALVGVFLGWQSVLFILMASAIQGLIYALGCHWLGRSQGAPTDESVDVDDASTSADDEHPAETLSFRHVAVPFGPFIVLSAFEWLVFDHTLLAIFHQWVIPPVA